MLFDFSRFLFAALRLVEKRGKGQKEEKGIFQFEQIKKKKQPALFRMECFFFSFYWNDSGGTERERTLLFSLFLCFVIRKRERKKNRNFDRMDGEREEERRR